MEYKLGRTVFGGRVKLVTLSLNLEKNTPDFNVTKIFSIEKVKDKHTLPFRLKY